MKNQIITNKIAGEGNNTIGFCRIASEINGCIYYPCCKPSDRKTFCHLKSCLFCDSRRCKPNADGTIDINNVPCKKRNNK